MECCIINCCADISKVGAIGISENANSEECSHPRETQEQTDRESLQSASQRWRHHLLQFLQATALAV